jgi:hypothetical protein
MPKEENKILPGYTGIVSKTLWQECRGEIIEGILAVASVIWNRSKKHNTSLDMVCMKDYQFSCWNEDDSGTSLNRHMNEKWEFATSFIPKPRNVNELKILAELQKIEIQMYEGTFVPTGLWTHYHTLSVHPPWSDGMTDKETIGNHLFGVTK